ncbi:MAG TPA: SPOR domain-containing protein [Steroidobacteraceae bacterium]|nr:SPOR domain-containing protein [Steroidobacteraceae bacterium]
MEGPLKERLTGALIVVAVLVIVVPEMLSGPGKPPAAGNGGGDAGPPVRTYSLELGTSAAARTQDQSALTPQSAEPAVQPLQTPPPAAPVQAGTPAAQPPQAESAPPAADVKPAPASAATAKKQWWTQLGSFSARNNAERLARELRDKGYSIDIARIKVGNRDLYRVRAGPVASREAAVALQSRLAAAGHKSSLVPP